MKKIIKVLIATFVVSVLFFNSSSNTKAASCTDDLSEACEYPGGFLSDVELCSSGCGPRDLGAGNFQCYENTGDEYWYHATPEEAEDAFDNAQAWCATCSTCCEIVNINPTLTSSYYQATCYSGVSEPPESSNIENTYDCYDYRLVEERCDESAGYYYDNDPVGDCLSYFNEYDIPCTLNSIACVGETPSGTCPGASCSCPTGCTPRDLNLLGYTCVAEEGTTEDGQRCMHDSECETGTCDSDFNSGLFWGICTSEEIDPEDGEDPEIPPYDPCEGVEDQTACEACVSQGMAYSALGGSSGCFPTDPSAFAAEIIKILFGLAGGVAFIIMVYAAFLCITSKGDPQKAQACRETVTAAVVGLLMLIFSLLIVQVIFSPGGIISGYLTTWN